MASLILTTLPFVVTFAVAAWHVPHKEVQPRSALIPHNVAPSRPRR